jgi:hypothetical protein
MTEYQDGQIVNGHRFDAATNTWLPVADPYQWATMSPLPPVKPWYRKPGWIAAMILGFFFIVVPTVSVFSTSPAAQQAAPQPAAPAPAAPAPQPVAPAPAPPAPEPVAPAPEPVAPEESNDDLINVLLQTAWDQQSASGQTDICNGWSLGTEFQEVLIDTFVESANAVPVTRQQIRSFFDGKC